MKAFWLALLCCMALAVTGPRTVSAVPLDSLFTYQGQLNQNGSPVSGIAHFRFSLWNAASGGSRILSAYQIVPNVLVTGGIFSVQLNGGNRFNGDARWLLVEVCSDGTCSSTTPLSPRQPITASPYALQSLQSLQTTNLVRLSGGVGVQINAGSATNTGLYANTKDAHDLVIGSFLDGGTAHGFISTGYYNGDRKVSIGRRSSLDNATAVFEPVLTVVSNTTNVGIGTTAPTAKLDVRGDIAMDAGRNPRLYTGTGALATHRYVEVIHTSDDYTASGVKAGGVLVSDTYSYANPGRSDLIVKGNVGVGTASPTAKLEVRGDIRMGSGGTELAASGSENLRIIRGTINGCGTGTIVYGSGFTLEAGCAANFTRRITFNTPFLSPPTVTANSTDCVGCNTRFCQIVSVTTTEVRIQEYTRSDGGYSGGPIQFIAIGPR